MGPWACHPQRFPLPGFNGLDFRLQVNFKYDSTTKPVGSSLYIHGVGQHDELCTSVKGKVRLRMGSIASARDGVTMSVN